MELQIKLQKNYQSDTVVNLSSEHHKYETERKMAKVMEGEKRCLVLLNLKEVVYRRKGNIT